ncbi:MAG: HAD domain-containing protein [Myxococcota bacterium]
MSDPKDQIRTVVFLDIDGVLNDAQPVDNIPTTTPGWVDLIDESRVALLNDLLERTHAEVVLSSSWRQIHSLEQMQAILEQAGFQGELVDQTPVIAKARGQQIAAWLAKNDQYIDRFVAIDDSMYMDPLPPDRRVQTSGRRGGITEDERDEAIEKIERQ